MQELHDSCPAYTTIKYFNSHYLGCKNYCHEFFMPFRIESPEGWNNNWQDEWNSEVSRIVLMRTNVKFIIGIGR
jgi:hypothetical protein